jgi:hypothetical protein
MIDDPKANEQLELFRQIAKEAIYDAYTLAEKYGLSDGQARALIKIYGPARTRLDKIIAAQPFP